MQKKHIYETLHECSQPLQKGHVTKIDMEIKFKMAAAAILNLVGRS